MKLHKIKKTAAIGIAAAMTFTCIPVTGIMADNSSAVVFEITIPDSATSTTVNSAMTEAAIRQAVENYDIINFEEGSYDGIVIGTVAGTKYLVMNGNVVFNGGSINKACISYAADTSLNILGGSLTISGYRDGIDATAKDGSVELNIGENTQLHLDENIATEQNHGNGIWVADRTVFTINTETGATFTADDNATCGINIIGAGKTAGQDNMILTCNFSNCAYVSLIRNKAGSEIHGGMEVGAGEIINFTSCEEVHLDGNRIDAICCSSGAVNQELKVTDCDNITFNNNGSWGTNGGNATITDSVMDISGNSSQPWSAVRQTASNFYCFTLTVNNSIITANGANANCGVWVSQTATINNSSITANANGMNANGYYNTREGYETYYRANFPYYSGNGIVFSGTAAINESSLTANNNGGAGIVFRNSMNDSNVSTVTDSDLMADNNGTSTIRDSYISSMNSNNSSMAMYKAGVAVLSGLVDISGGAMELTGNSMEGIGYYHDNAFAQQICAVSIDGNFIGTINSDNEIEDNEIRGNAQYKRTYVTGGSLDALKTNMTGFAAYDFNKTAAEDEIYTAPVNRNNTMLSLFVLNRADNLVASELINEFTVYDDNGESYEYSFSYDGDGNAYIWTPVSVVNYDATEGELVMTGSTVQTADNGLINGDDGTAVMNELTGEYVDAADYTVEGGSLALTQKVMPSAARTSYTFGGWYYVAPENVEAADTAAAAGDYDTLYSLFAGQFTNTTDIQSLGYESNEYVTVYARWNAPEVEGDEEETTTVPSRPGEVEADEDEIPTTPTTPTTQAKPGEVEADVDAADTTGSKIILYTGLIAAIAVPAVLALRKKEDKEA